MIVVFLGGVIDPILGRLRKALTGSPVFCAPGRVGVSILSFVRHLAVHNLIRRHDTDPWAAREPPDVGIVGGGFGVVGKVAHVPPEDNDLILDVAPRAAGEQLAE